MRGAAEPAPPPVSKPQTSPATELVSSDEVLTVEEGSLYPALYRMEEKGWIRSEWGKSENNRRAKFYALTRSGRRQLEQETALWEKLSRAISLVLQTA